MAEIPKTRQNYFNDLLKAITNKDDEALEFLLKNKDANAIRNDLGTALGQHINENFDKPINAFGKNQDLLKEIPVHRRELPAGLEGHYDQDSNQIWMKKQNPDLLHRDTGILTHELGHPNDLANGFVDANPINKELMKKEGLENAIKAIGQHHESGFFEKDALAKLLQNKKLSGILPVAGALGLGATALGIGNKAMAGDFGDAGMDTASLAADLTPGLGEAKMAITPSELGAEPTDPVSLKGSVFENSPERYSALKKKIAP